jgi:hypothetical protein
MEVIRQILTKVRQKNKIQQGTDFLGYDSLAKYSIVGGIYLNRYDCSECLFSAKLI